MKILVLGDFGGVFSEKLKKKLKKEKFDLVVGVGDYTGIKEWKPFIMYSLLEVKAGNQHPSPVDFFGKKKFKELIEKDRNAARNVLKSINGLGKPVIFVFGNGDDEWYKYRFDKILPVKKSNLNFIRKLENMKEITYSKTKFREISFVGFGGYMDIDSYFNKEEWKEEDNAKIKRRIKRREKSRRHFFKVLEKTRGEKIFVLHYPPKGVFDIIRDKKDNPMNGKSTGIRFFTEAIKKYTPKLAFCGHMHEYQGMKRLHGVPVINPGDAEKGKYAIVEVPEDRNEKINVRFVR
ncbi:MAG: metallophosphoesterase [Nanoarchaeota archaeon]